MSRSKLSLEEALKLAERLNFDKLNGLLPVVVQDLHTRDVLMQAFMDREALVKTLTTGLMHYWSRSRGRLWLKGETSGHYQRVVEAYADCDWDSLLFRVEQVGVCCHEGFYSCFHNMVLPRLEVSHAGGPAILSEVYEVVKDRLRRPRPGSYVASLASKGIDAVASKVVEEAMELVSAVKEGGRREVVHEAADLIFHVLVLLAASGKAELNEVFEELRARRR